MAEISHALPLEQTPIKKMYDLSISIQHYLKEVLVRTIRKGERRKRNKIQMRLERKR